MSQYPSFYINPVYRKEEQESLGKTGELQKLTHIPTRAALNDQTCSETHDSAIKYVFSFMNERRLLIMVTVYSSIM